MNVKIAETDEIKELNIIGRKSGTNYVADLLGNANALTDGTFIWSEEQDIYLADQDTYDWWAKYISDTEATETEAQALADELGISVDDIMLRIGDEQDTDYGQHRNQAQRAMAALREEFAK